MKQAQPIIATYAHMPLKSKKVINLIGSGKNQNYKHLASKHIFFYKLIINMINKNDLIISLSVFTEFDLLHKL